MADSVKPDRNARRAAATDTAREMLQSATDSGAAPHVKGDLASPAVPEKDPTELARQTQADFDKAAVPKASKKAVETPAPAVTPTPEEVWDFGKEYAALPDRMRTEIDDRFKAAETESRDAGMKFLTDRWQEMYGWSTPLLEAAKEDKYLRDALEAIIKDPEYGKAYTETLSKAEYREFLKDPVMRDFLFREAAPAYRPGLEAARALEPKPVVDPRVSELERQLAEIKERDSAQTRESEQKRQQQEYYDYRAREVLALSNEGAEDIRYDATAANREFQPGYVLTQHLVNIADQRSRTTGKFVSLKSVYDEHRASLARTPVHAAPITVTTQAQPTAGTRPPPPQAPGSKIERANAAVQAIKEAGGVNAMAGIETRK